MTDRSMVDANVLMFAFRKIDEKTTADVKQWHEASLALLKRFKVIRVSAIAWMEFARGLRPDDRARLSSIYAKIQSEVVDGRIVDRAIALMHARNLREKICQKCKTSLDTHECDSCKRMISAKQNMNDAIIAATAELADDVDVLYCYDGGVFHFADHIDKTRCRIEEPPHHIGPLFDSPKQK